MTSQVEFGLLSVIAMLDGLQCQWTAETVRLPCHCACADESNVISDANDTQNPTDARVVENGAISHAMSPDCKKIGLS